MASALLQRSHHLYTQTGSVEKEKGSMGKEALKREKIQQQVISVAPVLFLPHLLNDAFHRAGEDFSILQTTAFPALWDQQQHRLCCGLAKHPSAWWCWVSFPSQRGTMGAGRGAGKQTGCVGLETGLEMGQENLSPMSRCGGWTYIAARGKYSIFYYFGNLL